MALGGFVDPQRPDDYPLIGTVSRFQRLLLGMKMLRLSMAGNSQVPLKECGYGALIYLTAGCRKGQLDRFFFGY
jgi:hypothetical protein